MFLQITIQVIVIFSKIYKATLIKNDIAINNFKLIVLQLIGQRFLSTVFIRQLYSFLVNILTLFSLSLFRYVDNNHEILVEYDGLTNMKM